MEINRPVRRQDEGYVEGQQIGQQIGHLTCHDTYVMLYEYVCIRTEDISVYVMLYVQ